MDYEREFLKVYKGIGLTGYQNRKLSLHRSCRNRNDCWPYPPLRRGKYGGIIQPYVGPGYDTTRLAIVAINNRINVDPVCFESEYHYVRDAADGIRDGNKQGIYYYAAYWASVLLKIRSTNEDRPLILSDILKNKIAWAQAIKCNPPDTPNQNPYPSMLRKCPAHILRHELEILNPRRILVLGSTNWRYIRPVIEDITGKQLLSVGRRTKRPTVERWKLDDTTSDLGIIAVYHPGSSPYNKGLLTSVANKLAYLQLP
ncbi:MAG: uracil-DNA glycosylase family protein [Dehalococcoidales bacterium]|nr:uracil-DNA glycosylase family protein [Dehalococcoidales bacterium]